MNNETDEIVKRLKNIILKNRTKVKITNDAIIVDGKEIKIPNDKIYNINNKTNTFR